MLLLVLEKYERPASAVHTLFPVTRARLPAVRAFIDLLAEKLVLKGDDKPDARKRGPVTRRHQR